MFIESSIAIKNRDFPVNSVRKELDEVEKIISRQVDKFDTELQDYMDYICKTSGKRIRPVLAILAAGAHGKISEKNLTIGVIVELIHMATLVHDDVIDEADARRNQATPNYKWGNGMAVLLGDALFCHALLLSTEFDDLNICQKVGSAAKVVCEGEIIQSTKRFDASITQEEYLRIIGEKTGALFAIACSLSGRISGASEEEEKALYQYGWNLGTVYQLYDDCLDLVGDESQSGKTLRTDLKKGKLTLPLLKLLRGDDKEVTTLLNKKIKEQTPIFIQDIADSPAYPIAVNDTIQLGKNLLNDAVSGIAYLSESKFSKALIQTAAFIEDLLEKCRIK